MAPDLSIVIPSHRRADLLANCLRSIRQYAPVRIQTIVVDDGSPQGVVSSTAKLFSEVEIVRRDKPAGFCAAVNTGLRVARADVVQVLNDDTEVQPGWTNAPLERLKHDPTVAAVAPLVLRWPHGNVIDSAGDEYDPGGYAYSRGRGEVQLERWLTPGEVFSAPASAAFYRRDVLEQVGGFAESFVAYFDDIELGLRLRRAGYRCWYEPSSRVLHHGSASHGRRPGRRLAEQLARNEERVFCRFFTTERRMADLARHGLILGAKGVRRWADGTLVPFCMGRLRAWAEAAGYHTGPKR